jgi:phytoene/squalene synthetase
VNLLERRRLIEHTRSYLRRNDLIQGYLPQLAMEERASEWWCLLWYCVRRLDTLLDVSGDEINPTDPLKRVLASDEDFNKSLDLFLRETAGLVTRQLLNEMYRSIELERRLFTNGRAQSVEHYLSLVDRKAVIPVRICTLLNGIKADPDLIAQFTVGVGRAAQLLDDLLDLRVDLARGRLFITQDELSSLGLAPEDVLTNLDQIALQRNKWVMEVTWPAYKAANQLQDNNFALVARAWIEGMWKLIAEGKAVPLDQPILRNDLYFTHYMGASSMPFDLFPGSELLKYQCMHKPTVSFLKNYKIFDLDDARSAYEQIKADLKGVSGADAVEGSSTGTLVDDGKIPDSRRMFNIDDGFGLPMLMQEAPRISWTILADWGKKVTEGPGRGNLTGAIAEFAIDTLSLEHALRQDRLDFTRDTVMGMLPPDQPNVHGLIEFAFDYLSIVNEHQTAYYKDILTWMMPGFNEKET